MLEQLKKEVFEANIELYKSGLVLFTWGNVSGIDKEQNLVVIKPSGVPYSELKPEMMVVMDVGGKVVEGQLKPSSDAPTHIELYKAFPDICGIVHTHSTYATVFAQAGKDISAYGTTHADYFYGDIPCVRNLTKQELDEGYEANTGRIIARAFKGKNPLEIPGCIIKNHGPFTWGKTAADAVHNAVVLEQVAKMAYLTKTLNPQAEALEQYILDKHYKRKHGANAYYGQKRDK